jgi:hypothetical protein
MKKSTASLAAVTSMLLLLTISAPSFGQESHGAILLNMVNSRMNYGDMNGDLKGHKKDVRGLQAGLSWQAGLTKRFSIVTEAYFMTKGGTINADNPVDGIRSTLKLYTVEVPVLARFHAGRFYFNTGPYINYVVSGKELSDGERSRSIAFGPNAFRKFGTGIQTGAGYQFRIKKTKLAIDVRYIADLTSVSANEDRYNRTLNVSLLVLRSLKRKPTKEID